MTAPPSTSPPPVYTVGTLTYSRMGLVALFFWLLWGDFCFTLMEGVVPSVMPLQLAALHASNSTIGAVMTVIPIGIAMFANPVISFRSDRYRSRWGRRIPFIIATLPILVLSLIGLGFGREIGSWLHRHLGALTAGMSETQMMVATIAVMMVLFSFFNTFVNSVFWYLFNDVVPLHLLARFSAWFRVVGLGASSLYNFFIFKYWDHHAGAIFTGAALLYFFGFLLMCWKVREGEYPPPPPNLDGKTGLWSSIKTYARECHHPLYILMFCISAAQAAIWSSLPFMNLFYLATGLTMEQIGQVNGVAGIAGAVFYLGAAWLADRYHPLRIAIIGLAVQILIASPVQFYWLLARPTSHASFVYWMVITIAMIAPAGALVGAFGVAYMRLFPKTRFGQFCSANVIWRSTLQIASGLFIGTYFDHLKKGFGEQGTYFWLPAYQLFFYVMMLALTVGVYVLWKKHGGDDAYRPPGFEHEEETIRAHDEEPGFIDHPLPTPPAAPSR